MTDEIEKKQLLYEDGIDYTTPAFLDMFSGINDLVSTVLSSGLVIRQGYLPLETGKELSDYLGLEIDFEPEEARLRQKGEGLYFTLKGFASEDGLMRPEEEKALENKVFSKYWPLVESKVDKVRLERQHGSYTWEFDVFTDRKLVLAEVEVDTIEEAKRIPTIGRVVTNDKRYKNKNLAR